MDWNDVLARVTNLVMDSEAHDYLREDLPAEAVAGRQLARAGAPAAEVEALEARLGVRLPPSYREFLAKTNGMICCPMLGSFVRASQVGWFRDVNREWCEILEGRRAGSTEPAASAGSRLAPSRLAGRIDARLLQVNDTSAFGGETVLLNPRVVSAGGEWEAYALSTHSSMAERSFGALFLARLEQSEQFAAKMPVNPLTRLLPLMDLAAAARGGDTAGAKAEIERLYARGQVEAAVPLAEIAAFEWDWQRCKELARAVLERDPASARSLILPALWALAAARLDDWAGAEQVLEGLPLPTPETAEVYHRRLATVRRMLERREWTGLSGRLEPGMPGSEEQDAQARRAAFEQKCTQMTGGAGKTMPARLRFLVAHWPTGCPTWQRRSPVKQPGMARSATRTSSSPAATPRRGGPMTPGKRSLPPCRCGLHRQTRG